MWARDFSIDVSKTEIGSNIEAAAQVPLPKRKTRPKALRYVLFQLIFVFKTKSSLILACEWKVIHSKGSQNKINKKTLLLTFIIQLLGKCDSVRGIQGGKLLFVDVSKSLLDKNSLQRKTTHVTFSLFLPEGLVPPDTLVLRILDVRTWRDEKLFSVFKVNHFTDGICWRITAVKALAKSFELEWGGTVGRVIFTII